MGALLIDAAEDKPPAATVNGASVKEVANAYEQAIGGVDTVAHGTYVDG